MKDIESRADIELLIDTFYKDVLKDEVISHFFTKVVDVNWETHMPTMYSFWESVVLGTGSYRGNVTLTHVDLHMKSSVEPKHFERWLSLWKKTVSALFQGPMADAAINKSEQLALLMRIKIDSVVK
jgi:hemoglobin